MKRLRLSGSARLDTCSAETVVPLMTKRSTPASTTVFQSLLGALRGERAGDGDTGVTDRAQPLDDEPGTMSAW